MESMQENGVREMGRHREPKLASHQPCTAAATVSTTRPRMEKPAAISRPCLLLIFAAAIWVILTIHLRFHGLTAVPVVITDRVASFIPDHGGGGGGDPCRGRYIYIHDLPPRFNEDILRRCDTNPGHWPHMCDDVSNAGLGPPLAAAGALAGAEGWHATQQFALDAIFHARMRQYACLTNDSAAAAAVFVPFYAGYDFARHLWGYDNAARDAASLDLLRWLVQRPEWRRAGGRDHFLVAGRTAWDFRRDTDPRYSFWGTRLLFFPAAANMTVLTVETATFGEDGDLAVPYPTYFHPRADSDVLSWQQRVRHTNRPWLMSFVGAPRPSDRWSIRSQLIAQCRASPAACRHLGCTAGSQQCHSPADIMELFQSSTFCLQPVGDSKTRRSTFDAMVAGCIPVFFQPRAAHLQYLWHLPRDHASYSVLIPDDGVRSRNVSVEAELRKIPPAAVERMREEVIKLLPRLVYADPRYKLETLKDAVDVAVDGVLERVAKIRGTGD
ncbi:hypothetical protein ACP4OV_030835 [Aristida adscensionis]